MLSQNEYRRTIALQNGTIEELDKQTALPHMTTPIKDICRNFTTQKPFLEIENSSYTIDQKDILNQLNFTI